MTVTPQWTPAEDDYVQRHYATHTDSEIGDVLGPARAKRCAIAVRSWATYAADCRKDRRRKPRPTTRPRTRSPPRASEFSRRGTTPSANGGW